MLTPELCPLQLIAHPRQADLSRRRTSRFPDPATPFLAAEGGTIGGEDKDNYTLIILSLISFADKLLTILSSLRSDKIVSRAHAHGNHLKATRRWGFGNGS